MAEFRVEVPLNFTGQKEKNNDEVVKSIEKLNKTVYKTIDPVEILTSLIGDALKIFEPIRQLLSLLAMVILLPLMPLIKLIAYGLAKLIMWLMNIRESKLGIGALDILNKISESMDEQKEKLKDVFSGATGLLKEAFTNLWTDIKNFGTTIKDFGVWAWDNVLFPAFNFLKDVGKWIWDKILYPAFNFLKDVGKWIWDKIIQPAFNFLKDVGLWIWDNILSPAFSFLDEVGSWIWNDILKPAFEWLSDVGTKIWNILKPSFEWLKDKIKSVNISSGGKDLVKNIINDGVITPSGDIIKTDPRDYLIATKNPSSLVNNGSNIITINNPVIREDNDIKKLTEEISKLLGKKLWRSY